MAYVGADPELVDAAVEEKSGPPADGDKPAKAPKEPKAKAAPKADKTEDTGEDKAEPAKPETPEKPAPPEPGKEDTEADKSEDTGEDKEDDAKVAKGLASVARAQRDHLARKQAFEAQAARVAQQIEQRDKDVETREAQLKEREARLSDVEKAVQHAKAGDYDAIFSYLEAQGITAEAANAWLGKAPISPETRAQADRMALLEKRLEEREKRDQEREERTKREAQERQQREGTQKLLSLGTNEEKYPVLNAVYSAHEIYVKGLAELEIMLAPIGIGLSDLGSYPDEEVLAAYERALESADQKARSNQKLRSRLGVTEAPQHNGNGTHASKPATARTLTNGMTTEKSRTSIVTDDEADAESLRVLEDMKRAQAART